MCIHYVALYTPTMNFACTSYMVGLVLIYICVVASIFYTSYLNRSYGQREIGRESGKNVETHAKTLNSVDLLHSLK